MVFIVEDPGTTDLITISHVWTFLIDWCHLLSHHFLLLLYCWITPASYCCTLTVDIHVYHHHPRFGCNLSSHHLMILQCWLLWWHLNISKLLLWSCKDGIDIYLLHLVLSSCFQLVISTSDGSAVLITLRTFQHHTTVLHWSCEDHIDIHLLHLVQSSHQSWCSNIVGWFVIGGE